MKINNSVAKITIIIFIFLSVKPSCALEFVVSNESEIAWAFTVAHPGDIIKIANVTIEINGILSTLISGTEETPIVLEGVGPGSKIKDISDNPWAYALLVVSHSNWILRDFKIGGKHAYSIMVHVADNVLIQNVDIASSDDDEALVAFIVSDSKLVVDNCTVTCTQAGMYLGYSHGTVKNSTVINTKFLAKVTPEFMPVGILVEGGSGHVILGNSFLPKGPEDAFAFFVAISDSSFTSFIRNMGQRGAAGGFGVSMVYSPEDLQEYYFEGNHCDLQFDTYCITVMNEELFPKTIITADNTFENGRGLSNMPTFLHE